MTIRRVLRAVAEHHAETYRHLHAVHDMCYALARALDYGPGLAESIATAGLLHDVGKIHLELSVLDAPRLLTPAEWQAVRKHPLTGSALIAGAVHPKIANWIALHHERIDGSGYPYGLTGEAIPREVMVLAAVDVWDAISACRPYAAPHSIEERVAIFRGEADRIGRDIIDAHLALFGNDSAHVSASRDSRYIDEVAS